MTRTLYDKLVDAHKVCDLPDGDILAYVDFHIMNEYTSPQAFSGLGVKLAFRFCFGQRGRLV